MSDGSAKFCPKCGRENPEGAVYCTGCGEQLPVAAHPPGAPTPPPPPSPTPRTSGLAIASLVLGILAWMSWGLTALPGIVLGILGIRQVSRSQGRLTGQGLAIAGIAASVSSFLLLGLTAAILFPVFATARQKARTAACQSNLKEIALAMSMYAQDHHDRLPMKDNWCDALIPYTKNEELFRCPSLPDQRCGYAYNAELSKVSVSSIKSPAQTVSFFDAKGGWNLAGGAQLQDRRHQDGINLAFTDGHVKWTKEGESLLWKPGAP